ncbi:DUF2550 family protein [Georgenia sp. AZ-5]|uniref:DUF2550 family protein n=1 Tax=Georgenia sp. AZ-5 TaxID=3367526 RepID=UPI0037540E84
MTGTAWGVLLTLAAVLVVLVLFAVRVRRVANRVGSFECALRPVGHRDWTSGIANYGSGRIDWYRLVSLRLRPSRSWRRERLEIVGRERRPAAGGAGHVIEVRCAYDGVQFDVAMVDSALAGVVSWLEAAPPRGEPF